VWGVVARGGESNYVSGNETAKLLNRWERWDCWSCLSEGSRQSHGASCSHAFNLIEQKKKKPMFKSIDSINNLQVILLSPFFKIMQIATIIQTGSENR
jgi:hypothetical protein